MNSVSFGIRRVNRLRRAAEKARELASDLDRLPDTSAFSGEWSANDGANKLLGAFDALRLKAGFTLRAFVYREGSNGNGIIWAVPADAPPIAADECPRLEDTWLQPPKPPGALPLMQAIEGDGSPWSYLSASILSREAAEFGAIWHGCVWSDQTILSKPPRQVDDPNVRDHEDKLTEDAPLGNWTWCGAAPRTWQPTYADRGTSRQVVLHIHNAIGGEEIYRATDTYPVGSYVGQTETSAVCTGDRFIVY
ncbi:MAG: hypothetical protein F4W89_18485 [Acidobacteria bacterium]|nr:hypothetical protein [Acidobacteriota bacterium]